MNAQQLVQLYDRHAYTNQYVIGINYKGTIYACYCSSAIIPSIATIATASRDNGLSLRFKANNKKRALVFNSAYKTEMVCSAEYLEEVAHNVGKQTNRGTAFEKLFTEMHGQEWKKDSVPFTEAGDIEIDGTAYQIKYESATFCNEAQIRRLEN